MSKTVWENVKYQHSAIVLYVFYLSGENKICSAAKLGVGLCISSYEIEKQNFGFVFVNWVYVC